MRTTGLVTRDHLKSRYPELYAQCEKLPALSLQKNYQGCGSMSSCQFLLPAPVLQVLVWWSPINQNRTCVHQLRVLFARQIPIQESRHFQ